MNRHQTQLLKWGILVAVFRSGGELPLRSVSEMLDSNMEFDDPQLYRAVRRLRDDGYLNRVPHPTSARECVVVLTPLGVETCDWLANAFEGTNADMVRTVLARVTGTLSPRSNGSQRPVSARLSGSGCEGEAGFA